MKFIRKISDLEVKRCFVVSNLCAARTHLGHMKKVETEKHFLSRVAQVRARVLRMKTKSLDKLIGGEWSKRLISYNGSKWRIAVVSTSEVGVWTRAGEMPLNWTNGSLAETAVKVSQALNRRNGFKKKRIRAFHAIRGILKTSVNVIQQEKYLLPIVFKCDTGTQGRRRLKTKMKGDIDDGCMRSVALAVDGAKEIKVYFGVPKKIGFIES